MSNPITSWRMMVAREFGATVIGLSDKSELKLAALIEKHDPHAETVRLLEAAAKYVPTNAIKGDWRNKPIAEVRLLTQIDAHLAKLKETPQKS